jgi:hypothetical protein
MLLLYSEAKYGLRGQDSLICLKGKTGGFGRRLSSTKDGMRTISLNHSCTIDNTVENKEIYRQVKIRLAYTRQ